MSLRRFAKLHIGDKEIVSRWVCYINTQKLFKIIQRMDINNYRYKTRQYSESIKQQDAKISALDSIINKLESKLAA